MNSLYPSILFLVPSDKRVRLGAGILDAILDTYFSDSWTLDFFGLPYSVGVMKFNRFFSLVIGEVRIWLTPSHTW